MDARQADLLRTIEPSLLGQRLRAARVAKGMTQTDLAGEEVSVGYVSRIESGQRRPNLQVLADLALRLGTPVEQLLMGVAPQDLEKIRLTLDFAELSLESGQAQAAEAQAREAYEMAAAASLKELVYRARYLLARSLESQGFVDDAIIELEDLTAPQTGGVTRIKATIALSRCYRESGDFSKAIDVGERILHDLADTPLDSTDEAVQMAVTVAAAYFERGDVGQAVRVCRRAVSKAETLESATARASAYWNASIMEQAQGSVAAAIPLAERALALLSEGQDGRNLAGLRTQLGIMQLRMDPPQIDDAQQHLRQAAEEFAWCSAGPVEIARNELAQARAHYLKGEIELAQGLVGHVHEAVETQSPLVAAEAKSLEGLTFATQGRIVEAKRAYTEAVLTLTAVGADRGAAQLWFDLAGFLGDVGDLEASRNAYRSAAASTGLRVSSAVQIRLQV